jgi:putative aldouronate transport system permease protein
MKLLINSGIKPQYEFINTLKRDLIRNRHIYIMLLPVVVYYIVFHYLPMYGAQIAFKNFVPTKGILGSSWVGLEHFRTFIDSFYFLRLLRNTFLISIYSIIYGFPAPILFALLLNALLNKKFCRMVQTVSYFPHFISLIVICGIVTDFLSSGGPVNQIVSALGYQPVSFFMESKWFYGIYVVSGIWQDVGWESIIYLSALCSINPTLYEAASIDGANRLQKAIYISLPGIASTISTMLILRLGSLLSVGSEKIILLYNPTIYETADVVSSFVYRKGLQEMAFSYSTAVGLMLSLVNLLLLTAANRFSRKINDNSLW